MTGPADRTLAHPTTPDMLSSDRSEVRVHTTTYQSVRRRHTRRDVLALALGTAALLVVERRAAFAQEMVTLDASAVPPSDEGATPLADAPPTDTPPPAADAPAAPEAAPPVAVTTYVVQAGDTLFSIARKHGVSVDAVLWANDLSDANVLKAGQKLTIPPSTGKLHTVKDGDTLDTLAQTYSVSKTGIATVNGLTESSALKAGQRLLIPVAMKPPAGDPAFTPAPLQVPPTGLKPVN